MIDILVAVGGSVLALFLYNLYNRNSVKNGQKQLEEKTKEINTKVEQIEASIDKNKKETQDKLS